MQERAAERHGSVFPAEGRPLFLHSQIRQEAMQPDQRAVGTSYGFHLEQPAAGQPFPGSDQYLARATTVCFQLESLRETKVFQVIWTIPPLRESEKHEHLPS